MDSSDADFGSSSPSSSTCPGATPSTMVVAPAKTGHVYFLDAKKLGGMGGELIDLTPAPAASPRRPATRAARAPS
jgi:hypothetical protein